MRKFRYIESKRNLELRRCYLDVFDTVIDDLDLYHVEPKLYFVLEVKDFPKSIQRCWGSDVPIAGQARYPSYHVLIRDDLDFEQVIITIGHECRHLYQYAHEFPFCEEDAERYGRKVLQAFTVGDGVIRNNKYIWNGFAYEIVR